MRNIRKNDMVEVISGNSKGSKGKVLSVIPDKNRAIVEKVNMIKRHTKASQQNPQGGIVEREASINLSNLMLICNKCNKRTRVGFKILENGKKVRVCKVCKEIIDK